MSGWGDFTSLASSALKNAQAKIDKVLDIKDEEGQGSSGTTQPSTAATASTAASTAASLLSSPAVSKLQDDFFTAFGLSSQAAGETAATSSTASEGKEAPLRVETAEKEAKRETSSEVAAEPSPSSSLNISQWLMGGSGVDAASPPQPPPNRGTAKKARSLGTRRSTASEEARGGEKRSKTTASAAPSLGPEASATLEESSEAELLLLQLAEPTTTATESPPPASQPLLIAAEGLSMSPAAAEELGTPKAEGWEDAEWSRSAQLEASAMLRSASQNTVTEDMGTSLASSDTATTVVQLSKVSSVEEDLSEGAASAEAKELAVETGSIASSPPAAPTTATPSPPDHGSEEETAGEDSLTSSFVRLTTASATGSPPLSTQKSETSSLARGYASPTETAASSDIEIISNQGNDNGSERSWAPKPAAATAHPSHKHKRGGSDVVAKLMESLEARERQNLDQSSQLMALVEENEELKAKLASLGGEDAAAGLANLREKFAQVMEEKEALRSRLEVLGTADARLAQAERALKEKEEQVADLMREGEAWSAKEHKQHTTIKKLREKEKASEKTAEGLRKRLEEMDALRADLAAKKEAEIAYDEAVHSLRSTAEKAERKQKTAELAATEARDKAAGLQASLDSAYAQIAQLSAAQAEKERRIAKLTDDVSASQEAQLKEALDEAETQRASECGELARRAEELRTALERAAAEADAAETALKADVASLQRRLAEAESRNEALAAEATAAAAPLLRQMDSLSASHAAQAGQWERLEADLYARLGAAEKRCLDAEAKEATGQAALLDLRSELAKARNQAEAAERRADELGRELAKAKTERSSLEAKASAALGQVQAQRSLHEGQLAEAREEKELLSAQLGAERKAEREVLEGRIKDLLRQLEDKESAVGSLRSQLLESATTIPGPPALARPPSPSWSQRSGLGGAGLSLGEEGGVGDWASDVSGTSYGALVETLRGRLQQRDGEVGVLREELRAVAASRDAAAARIAADAQGAAALAAARDELAELRRSLASVEEKHSALLAMYGEKAEENEELRLDLADLKAAYRQQIQDLLKE